jgi:alkylhydroperoxidase family enzyme
MIEASGIYRVTVKEANNPTYLKSGVYRVEVLGKSGRQEANFRSSGGWITSQSTWDRQSGTYERLNMLQGFEKQARVICTRVEDSELDALSNSLFGIDSFSKLTEAQQIEACRAGVRA